MEHRIVMEKSAKKVGVRSSLLNTTPVNKKGVPTLGPLRSHVLSIRLILCQIRVDQWEQSEFPVNLTVYQFNLHTLKAK